MSNSAEVKELVEALTPTGRATVAFLAASRLGDIAADERFERYFAGGPQVFSDAIAACGALARAENPTVSLESMLDAIVELLGPPDEDSEEPEYEGTWSLDALAAAESAVKAWAEPDNSARWCDNALRSLTSSVGFLARGLRDNQVEERVAAAAGHTGELSSLEAARQREDIQAIGLRGGDALDELVGHSQQLARYYGFAYRALTTGRD
jgi:hypothetical protein